MRFPWVREVCANSSQRLEACLLPTYYKKTLYKSLASQLSLEKSTETLLRRVTCQATSQKMLVIISTGKHGATWAISWKRTSFYSATQAPGKTINDQHSLQV